MSRRQNTNPLYDAFQNFLNLCILKDYSLIWPTERFWTTDNVAEVKRKLVDAPILGADTSFEEKLLIQMKEASREQWGIICDIYYVYFLPSASIRLEKKQHDIKWAAEQGGLQPPSYDAGIWEAQKCGFVGTTFKYHTKYAQFWLVILLANLVKNDPSMRGILSKPDGMQSALDDLLEQIPTRSDRGYDMRHAILYMAFPDEYERIISTNDKERIVERFKGLIRMPDPLDLDEAIRRIRKALAKEYDNTPEGPLDFYQPGLKEQWKTSGQTVVEKPGGGKEAVPPRRKEDLTEEVGTVLTTLRYTRNLILYGPPGTGKTYIANKTATEVVREQTGKGLSDDVRLQKVVEGLTVYEVLALAMYSGGHSRLYRVPELVQHKLVQERFRLAPVKFQSQVVWGNLQNHTDPNSLNVRVSSRHEPFLFDKDDESRWMLTEMGRRYVEESLKSQLSDLKAGSAKSATAADFITWTTFHQSYSYEDFIEGLRPLSSEDEPGSISYAVVPGLFKRACARAAEDSANKYVFIIDEINRGNIAKIFGELTTLLEDDKRSGQQNATYARLPYSGEEFTVPANLVVIGTMNTADRSIALLDVALRRRFAFLEVMPRPELLNGTVVETSEASVELSQLLTTLNRKIEQYVDRDHQIGHSYFLKVANSSPAQQADTLAFVWNHQIMPLLEEYFYSQRDKLAEVLKVFLTDIDISPGGGPNGYEQIEIGHETGLDLLAALDRLAKS